MSCAQAATNWAILLIASRIVVVVMDSSRFATALDCATDAAAHADRPSGPDKAASAPPMAGKLHTASPIVGHGSAAPFPARAFGQKRQDQSLPRGMRDRATASAPRPAFHQPNINQFLAVSALLCQEFTRARQVIYSHRRYSFREWSATAGGRPAGEPARRLTGAARWATRRS